MKAMKYLTLCAVLAAASTCLSASWKKELKTQLPLLGHRNWIVVADSAYPLQTAPGIKTVYADSAQLEVIANVLEALNKAAHVQPIIYTDKELAAVSEADAPGIGAYRAGLSGLLEGQPVQVLPHEEIIAKLDEAGKTFNILLIKTPLALPCTSVFLQLECGYWNAGAEQRLREALKTDS